MKNMTTRQRSLYLSAKLYELAAEFTDSELSEILSEQSTRSKPIAISQAIRALMQLHDEVMPPESKADSTDREVARAVNAEEAADRTPSRQTSSLPTLLDDREAFPTVADIAKALRIDARPKEPRDRYVTRVTKLVENMSSRERSMFFNELAITLNKRPDNFISRWSKLIKEL